MDDNRMLRIILIVIALLYVVSPADIAPGSLIDDIVVVFGIMAIQKQLKD